MKIEIQNPFGGSIIYTVPDTETVASETVASETVASETVASETVASETVASETVVSETVENTPGVMSSVPKPVPIENNQGSSWFSGTSWG